MRAAFVRRQRLSLADGFDHFAVVFARRVWGRQCSWSNSRVEFALKKRTILQKILKLTLRVRATVFFM
jgi:hypothetical protein